MHTGPASPTPAAGPREEIRCVTCGHLFETIRRHDVVVPVNLDTPEPALAMFVGGPGTAPRHPLTVDVLGAISEERARQAAEWGGAAHDDGHDPFDWLLYLSKHLTKASAFARSPDGYRRQLVRVAALAIAAVESRDRVEKLDAARSREDFTSGPGLRS